MTDWIFNDNYSRSCPIPNEFNLYAGPNGVATVRVWDNGSTEKGWGLKSKAGEHSFMQLYTSNRFNPKRIIGSSPDITPPFAFVMRSMSLICIDIDGKNGGFDSIKKLGYLPQTLAEISKSKDGYHLFYYTSDIWNSETGFASFGDRVSIEQGIDLRATGCVYHYTKQRWNTSDIAALPTHLHELFTAKETVKKLSDKLIQNTIANADQDELLLLQEELKNDLAKPIIDGTRNNTLFAIGSKMKALNVPNWPDLIRTRGTDLGLPDFEIEKLIYNIDVYAS